MPIYQKSVRELIRDEMVPTLLMSTSDFTRQQAMSWFQQHYPKIKKNTVYCHLTRLSTNLRSRKNWTVKPGEDDLFVQTEQGSFRLYDKERDPAPFYENATRDGISDECQSSPQDNSMQTLESDGEFAYEHDLRDYLARNLHMIESGLHLYTDEGITGVEFPVGRKFIDILAVDTSKNLVVIELKVSRGYDRVIGQLLNYMTGIEENLAEPGQLVRGIIIGREITTDLRMACKKIKDVSLYEYQLSVSLKPIK